jgi:hypothetical protein
VIRSFPTISCVSKGDRAQAFTEKGEAYPIIFVSPIDLQVGDLCTVDTADGLLFSVERRGDIVWRNVEDRP